MELRAVGTGGASGAAAGGVMSASEHDQSASCGKIPVKISAGEEKSKRRALK